MHKHTKRWTSRKKRLNIHETRDKGSKLELCESEKMLFSLFRSLSVFGLALSCSQMQYTMPYTTYIANGISYHCRIIKIFLHEMKSTIPTQSDGTHTHKAHWFKSKMKLKKFIKWAGRGMKAEIHLKVECSQCTDQNRVYASWNAAQHE